MKSRPILFSGPMVRALLDGSKTQTRRILKGSTEFKGSYNPDYLHVHKNAPGWSDICPYGKPGDQLWVRETHAFTDLADGTPVVTYSANSSQIAIGNAADGTGDYLIKEYKFAEIVSVDRWRPSIHMPRWASRITLEVTGVRVERLQDISEADAIADGCTKNHNGYYWAGPHDVSGRKQMPTAKSAYIDLWESINGPGSWDMNPWVWVIEFRRLS